MMLKRIIPCLDINEGRVVKGVKFEGIRDVGDPVELARRYDAEGADELAMLNINASDKNRTAFLELVESVVAEITIPLCVGGGIGSVDDMREAIKAGADKVSVCSSALARPELLSEMADAFGSNCLVLAIDTKRVSTPGEKPRWHAFSGGGRTDTGLDAIEWARKGAALGASEIILTSIDTDGTNAGYDLELCAAVAEAVPIPVIASGGAGSLEQIAEVLKKTKVAAALVASLLHFGKVSVPEIKKYTESQGVPIKW